MATDLMLFLLLSAVLVHAVMSELRHRELMRLLERLLEEHSD